MRRILVPIIAVMLLAGCGAAPAVSTPVVSSRPPNAAAIGGTAPSPVRNTVDGAPARTVTSAPTPAPRTITVTTAATATVSATATATVTETATATKTVAKTRTVRITATRRTTAIRVRTTTALRTSTVTAWRTVTVQAPQQQTGCYPTSAAGNCYRAGEFCAARDHGGTGVDADGRQIRCVPSGSRWRWMYS